MTFVHGKNAAVLFGAKALTSYFNEATSSQAVETAETTTFGNNAKTYIVGLKDGTVSASGMFDGDSGAVDETLSSVIGAASANVVTVAPEGLTAGKRSMSCAGHETSYEVTSPVGDVVSVSMEIQATGGIDSGVLLAAASGVSATGNGTAVDNAASSTNGGAGYLHVTGNTRDGSTTVKVQHSADNSTWTDLITFTVVGSSATAAEAATATGTVNRYVRASHTLAGSSGTFTYTLSFARR